MYAQRTALVDFVRAGMAAPPTHFATDQKPNTLGTLYFGTQQLSVDAIIDKKFLFALDLSCVPVHRGVLGAEMQR